MKNLIVNVNKKEVFKVVYTNKLNPADVSLKHDLFFATANLISTEWHSQFSFMLTENEEYIKFAKIIRDIRAECFMDLIENKEAEAWCMAKHLIESHTRLTEVATKFEKAGDREKAKKYFKMAKEIYDSFWVIQKKEFRKEELKEVDKK